MTGVCVVRVETHESGVLLSVSTRRDLEAPAEGPTAPTRFGSVDDAVAAIDSFLREFEVQSGGVPGEDGR